MYTTFFLLVLKELLKFYSPTYLIDQWYYNCSKKKKHQNVINKLHVGILETYKPALRHSSCIYFLFPRKHPHSFLLSNVLWFCIWLKILMLRFTMHSQCSSQKILLEGQSGPYNPFWGARFFNKGPIYQYLSNMQKRRNSWKVEEMKMAVYLKLRWSIPFYTQ